MNYFGISHTYRQVLELDQWLRRRVREQGVPDLRAQWIGLHYGSTQNPHMDIASVNLTGTAGCGPA